MKGRLVVLNPSPIKRPIFTGYSRRLDVKEGRDFLVEMKKSADAG